MASDQLNCFADPMCSWRWGFRPVMAAARARYGGRLELRPVLGGLAIGADRPLDARAKRSIRAHWELVAALAGKLGFAPERLAAELDAEATRQETLADFPSARDCDVDGYPALIAGNPRSGYPFTTFGYQPWQEIRGTIDPWPDGRDQPMAD